MQEYLDKHHVNKLSVKLTPEDYHFLKSKRISELESWKQQHGATELSFEKSPEQIVVTGKPSIQILIEEITSLVKVNAFLIAYTHSYCIEIEKTYCSTNANRCCSIQVT